MLKVRVIKPFKRRGEIIPLDSIIEIPDEILTKLIGFVEVLPCEDSGYPDLPRVLGERLASIDRAGRPWAQNFFDRISRSDHDKEKALVRRIDAAVLVSDRESLETLILEWRDFLLDRRSQQQPRRRK